MCQGMEQNLSTASVGTRKRRGEGHTRRDEILIAAKELFLREGYQATTIRRIADVVGFGTVWSPRANWKITGRVMYGA